MPQSAKFAGVDKHWMRFRKLDGANHHCLQVWKTDNTWHDDIRVKAALFLQARDDKHWMRFKYMKNEKYDTFYVWNVKDIWYHSLRVGAANKLRD
ncbi:MAG: hypothetical protein KME64_27245 [Scytonematopsis contorta HA4267-MV1]|jgi:hypothetical protein|nr:hypothetical protein [Scytonematopsis contorta HA4267-MV1]